MLLSTWIRWHLSILDNFIDKLSKSSCNEFMRNIKKTMHCRDYLSYESNTIY